MDSSTSFTEEDLRRCRTVAEVNRLVSCCGVATSSLTPTNAYKALFRLAELTSSSSSSSASSCASRGGGGGRGGGTTSSSSAAGGSALKRSLRNRAMPLLLLEEEPASSPGVQGDKSIGTSIRLLWALNALGLGFDASEANENDTKFSALASRLAARIISIGPSKPLNVAGGGGGALVTRRHEAASAAAVAAASVSRPAEDGAGGGSRFSPLANGQTLALAAEVLAAAYERGPHQQPPGAAASSSSSSFSSGRNPRASAKGNVVPSCAFRATSSINSTSSSTSGLATASKLDPALVVIASIASKMPPSSFQPVDAARILVAFATARTCVGDGGLVRFVERDIFYAHTQKNAPSRLICAPAHII